MQSRETDRQTDRQTETERDTERDTQKEQLEPLLVELNKSSGLFQKPQWGYMKEHQ